MSTLFQASRIPRRLMMTAAVALGLLLVVGTSPKADAQHRGGGRGGGGFPGGGIGGMHGGGVPRGIGDREGFPRPNAGPPPNARDQGANPGSTMRPGLQVGPPGRWWDDKHFAKQLRLSSDQQHRMDNIFEQNRPALLKRFEGLQQEEQKMEALTHASTLDENALFAQIDRVAQARADLEKATTHYLFQLRNEMDADQLSRLEEQR